MCNMSTDLLSESRHVIIEQSLLSGLPNEVDFAINVCTLLSTEGRHALQLTTCPRLLPLLLGHVGVFEDGPGSLYPVYQYAWTQYCKRNYLRVFRIPTLLNNTISRQHYILKCNIFTIQQYILGAL